MVIIIAGNKADGDMMVEAAECRSGAHNSRNRPFIDQQRSMKKTEQITNHKLTTRSQHHGSNDDRKNDEISNDKRQRKAKKERHEAKQSEFFTNSRLFESP